MIHSHLACIRRELFHEHYSLNNGLYCTKGVHSHLVFGQIFCGQKSLMMGCVLIFRDFVDWKVDAKVLLINRRCEWTFHYCDCVDDCVNHFFHCNHNSEVDFIIFRSSFQNYFVLPQVFLRILKRVSKVFSFIFLLQNVRHSKKETLFLYLFFKGKFLVSTLMKWSF